jgi:hypothetical protein
VLELGAFLASDRVRPGHYRPVRRASEDQVAHPVVLEQELAGELGDAGAGTPGAAQAAAGCSTAASSRLQRNGVVEHSSQATDSKTSREECDVL